MVLGGCEVLVERTGLEEELKTSDEDTQEIHRRYTLTLAG